MNCIICDSTSRYFFSKEYSRNPYGFLMKDIGEVEYYKCTNCGFTISKTHCELSDDRWRRLNYDFHHYLETNNTSTNQPPYLEQALMINVLTSNGIINTEEALDYAGGYGTLSKILTRYFGIQLSVYDPYIRDDKQSYYVNRNELGKYKTVLNSAIFEHLSDRKSFNEINALVANEGCMIVHTVVCDNVPKDPNWFYLEPPVHCSFHTNKSMSILMKQWGYSSSVYCPAAKSWVLFKEESMDIESEVDAINIEFQIEYLLYKKGFVDYWKGY